MPARIEQARGFQTSLVLAPQVVAGMGEESEAARILGSVETIVCRRVNTPEEIVFLAGTRRAIEYSTHYFRSGERRVREEWRSQCDWSSDVCSSDLCQRASSRRAAFRRASCSPPKWWRAWARRAKPRASLAASRRSSAAASTRRRRSCSSRARAGRSSTPRTISDPESGGYGKSGDLSVTGVQTCALPIYASAHRAGARLSDEPRARPPSGGGHGRGERSRAHPWQRRDDRLPPRQHAGGDRVPRGHAQGDRVLHALFQIRRAAGTGRVEISV